MEQLLAALKVDLGIMNTTAYDERLTQYIEAAQDFIIREGAALQDTPEDNHLVVNYAAWMWRKRDTHEGMPRMLRWQLNNRILSQHMED